VTRWRTWRRKHAHPLHVLERFAILFVARGDQAGGAGIDDARGHVGLLQRRAQAQELVPDVAADVRAEQAGDLQAAVDDALQELHAVAPAQTALALRADVKVQVVDRFPDVLWQRVADAAQDFPGGIHGRAQR